MGNTSWFSRAKNGWNAFRNRDPTVVYREHSYGEYRRPDRARFTYGNERSIATSIYNRMAWDVATTKLRHVRLDKDGRYEDDINSTLNECLTLEANLDQISTAFFYDAALKMFDKGVVALVPVDVKEDQSPWEFKDSSFNITSMRTGEIVEWRPTQVKVLVYDGNDGQKKEIWVEKRWTPIIENPFYPVMNEPNSTLKRLIRKLNIIDAIDEQSGSGKLDLIVQLPYTIRGEARKKQANERKAAIEDQLANSKFGIAYIDTAEHVTQLNRPIENNLMKQVEYLTNLLYSQLTINQSIMDGTADANTMSNYFTRSIDLCVDLFVDEIKRKWLTKTARTQGQSIMAFRDVFKLATLEQIASAADTFTRNEIMSKNEIRQKMGMKPSKDPKADQLINSNIAQSNNGQAMEQTPEQGHEETENTQEQTELTDEEIIDSMNDAQLDLLYRMIGESDEGSQ